jgi:hypothetical protein
LRGENSTTLGGRLGDWRGRSTRSRRHGGGSARQNQPWTSWGRRGFGAFGSQTPHRSAKNSSGVAATQQHPAIALGVHALPILSISYAPMQEDEPKQARALCWPVWRPRRALRAWPRRALIRPGRATLCFGLKTTLRMTSAKRTATLARRMAGTKPRQRRDGREGRAATAGTGAPQGKPLRGRHWRHWRRGRQFAEGRNEVDGQTVIGAGARPGEPRHASALEELGAAVNCAALLGTSSPPWRRTAGKARAARLVCFWNILLAGTAVAIAAMWQDRSVSRFVVCRVRLPFGVRTGCRRGIVATELNQPAAKLPPPARDEARAHRQVRPAPMPPPGLPMPALR